MNDFTKEELEILLHLLDCRGLADSDLQIKIQSMIDNDYCEHFGAIQLDDEFRPVSPETCLYCGKAL